MMDTATLQISNSTLSWQSAFFGFSAVLFATLLQPAGAVHEKPFGDRVTLRSSPILSATDTLLCIAKYTRLLSLGCGPQQAARWVWYERFRRDNAALSIHNAEETTQTFEEGSAIDNLWRWSMVAFVVGALTQCIKLFACKGIPGTQTLVAICLTSFLVMEYLRTVGGRARPLDFHTSGSMRKVDTAFRRSQGLIFTAGIMIQAVVWIWIVFCGLPWSWFGSNSYWRWAIINYNNLAAEQDKLADYVAGRIDASELSFDPLVKLAKTHGATPWGTALIEACQRRAEYYRSIAASLGESVRWTQTTLTEVTNVAVITLLLVSLLAFGCTCILAWLNEDAFEASYQLYPPDSIQLHSSKSQSRIATTMERMGSWCIKYPVLLGIGLFAFFGYFAVPIIFAARALEKAACNVGRGYGVVVMASISRGSIAFLVLMGAVLGFSIVYWIFLSGAIGQYTRLVFGLPGKASWREFASIVFMLLNIGTLFFYYSDVYDTQTTYKPGWTDVFG